MNKKIAFSSLLTFFIQVQASVMPVSATAAMYLAMNSSDEASFIALLTQNPGIANTTTGICKKTSLMRAAYMGKTHLMTLLIRYGAQLDSVDTEGNTALIHAARQSSFEPVKLLVESGASADHVSIDGKTALSTAVSNYQDPKNKMNTYRFRAIADYLHAQIALRIGTIQSVLATYNILADLSGIIIAYQINAADMATIEKDTRVALSVSHQLSGQRIKRKNSFPLASKKAAEKKKK